jgi:hypothetical protein
MTARYEHVLAARDLGHDETVTRTGHIDGPCDQLEPIWESVPTLPLAEDVAVALHVSQTSTKGTVSVSVDVESTG